MVRLSTRMPAMLLIALIACISNVVAEVTSSSMTSKANSLSLAINVPNDNSQDLYFYFQAPVNDNSNWASFGMGTGMDKALMFVIYRSLISDGAPTISPRIGSGHQMPTHTDQVGITEIAGSKIVNGQATVNFKCTGCRDWKVGKLDTNSTAAPFFYALGPNNRLESNLMNAAILRHRLHSDIFTLDMKAATGPGGIPSMTATIPDSTKDVTSQNDNKILGMTSSSAAHAGAMTLAFLILFPGGYLLLRLIDNVRAHYSMQSLAALVAIGGIGIGVYISIAESMSPNLTHPHQIIGLIVVVLIFAAWGLGLAGHIVFKRSQKKSPIMKIHRVVGPVTILLGFINGIVGFYWAGNSHWVVFGWCLIDGIVWIIISILLTLKRRRKGRTGPGNTAKVVPVWAPRTAGYDKIHEQGQGSASTAYDGGAQHQTDAAIPLQEYGRQH